jgi:hypothetical protein
MSLLVLFALRKTDPPLILVVDVRRRSSKGCSERFTSGHDGDVPECEGGRLILQWLIFGGKMLQKPWASI